MIDNKCKKCRRVGEKLFLKGERCFSQKCSMIRTPYPPGLNMKKNQRGRQSEYGRQLKEKQRLRLLFGIKERQLENYVKKSLAKKNVDVGEFLLMSLESRLDNVVFRLGLARSRNQARQIVNHGHILVEGKKVSIPSYQVKPKQTIAFKAGLKTSSFVDAYKAAGKKQNVPSWLGLDKEKLEGRVMHYPTADELEDIGRTQLILEYYSR